MGKIKRYTVQRILYPFRFLESWSMTSPARVWVIRAANSPLGPRIGGWVKLGCESIWTQSPSTINNKLTIRKPQVYYGMFRNPSLFASTSCQADRTRSSTNRCTTCKVYLGGPRPWNDDDLLCISPKVDGAEANKGGKQHIRHQTNQKSISVHEKITTCFQEMALPFPFFIIFLWTERPFVASNNWMTFLAALFVQVTIGPRRPSSRTAAPRQWPGS